MQFGDVAGMFKKKMDDMAPKESESESEDMGVEPPTSEEEAPAKELSASEQKLLDKVKEACSSPAFKAEIAKLVE